MRTKTTSRPGRPRVRRATAGPHGSRGWDLVPYDLEASEEEVDAWAEVSLGGGTKAAGQ